MLLARITGSLVASQKAAKLVGQKLFLIEPCRVEPTKQQSLIGTQRTMVAVDTVGSGPGQLVLVVQGSSARFTPETEGLPVDAAIVGIVNQVTLGERVLSSES